MTKYSLLSTLPGNNAANVRQKEIRNVYTALQKREGRSVPLNQKNLDQRTIEVFLELEKKKGKNANLNNIRKAEQMLRLGMPIEDEPSLLSTLKGNENYKGQTGPIRTRSTY